MRLASVSEPTVEVGKVPVLLVKPNEMVAPRYLIIGVVLIPDDPVGGQLEEVIRVDGV